MRHLRPWRWTCPHCGVGTMKIQAADRHLKRKHYDCTSCKLERLLIQGMIDNRYFTMAVKEDPFADLSRARG